MSLPSDTIRKVRAFMAYQYALEDWQTDWLFRDYGDVAQRAYQAGDGVERIGRKLMDAWLEHDPRKARKRNDSQNTQTDTD